MSHNCMYLGTVSITMLDNSPLRWSRDCVDSSDLASELCCAGRGQGEVGVSTFNLQLQPTNFGVILNIYCIVTLTLTWVKEYQHLSTWTFLPSDLDLALPWLRIVGYCELEHLLPSDLDLALPWLRIVRICVPEHLLPSDLDHDLGWGASSFFYSTIVLPLLTLRDRIRMDSSIVVSTLPRCCLTCVHYLISGDGTWCPVGFVISHFDSVLFHGPGRRAVCHIALTGVIFPCFRTIISYLLRVFRRKVLFLLINIWVCVPFIVYFDNFSWKFNIIGRIVVIIIVLSNNYCYCVIEVEL